MNDKQLIAKWQEIQAGDYAPLHDRVVAFAHAIAPAPGTEFWVIMVKRSDGKVYADLHKVPDSEFFLTEEDAIRAWSQIGPAKSSYHVVGLLARLP